MGRPLYEKNGFVKMEDEWRTDQMTRVYFVRHAHSRNTNGKKTGTRP